MPLLACALQEARPCCSPPITRSLLINNAQAARIGVWQTKHGASGHLKTPTQVAKKAASSDTEMEACSEMCSIYQLQSHPTFLLSDEQED